MPPPSPLALRGFGALCFAGNMAVEVPTRATRGRGEVEDILPHRELQTRPLSDTKCQESKTEITV